MLPRPPEKKSEKEAEKTWAKSLGLFSVITADLLGFTGAGIGIGYWLWKKQGFPIWVLPAFSVVGLILAFYRLYEVSKKDWND